MRSCPIVRLNETFHKIETLRILAIDASPPLGPSSTNNETDVFYFLFYFFLE